MSGSKRSPLFRLAGLGLVGGVVVLGASSAGCRKLSTDISLTDPNNLKARAAWVEFDVFDGGCPTKLQLAQSSYPAPTQSQVLAVDGELNPIGDLSSGTYGFAVLLRQDDCAVVGFGCTNANVKSVRSVNVQINPTFIDASGNLFPQGSCVAPLSCQQGVCAAGGPVEGDGDAGAAGAAGSGGATAGAGGAAAGAGGAKPTAGAGGAVAGAGGAAAGAGGAKPMAGAAGAAGSTAGAAGAAGSAAGAAGASGAAGGAGILPPPAVVHSRCAMEADKAPGSGACTMQLVGWIELPEPQNKGGQVAGPTVTATDTGFVIGYDELSADGSEGRFVSLPVGLDGCTAAASATDLDKTTDPVASLIGLPAFAGSGFDTSQLGTRAISATGQSAGLALRWSDLSRTMPTEEGSMLFTKKVIPPLETFDGKQVAMATGNGRVLVAWVSHRTASSDPVGGAAIFRCEP